MSRKVIGGLASAVVIVLVALFLFRHVIAPPSPLAKQVTQIKAVVVDVQRTFTEGKLQESGPGRPDGRVFVINVGLDKLQSQISRREKDDTRRQAALANLGDALKVVNEFIPKFDQAVAKKDLAAAKGFIGYTTVLQQHLDALLKSLNS